ncbi:uncharacterized protein RHIMIDRAFT_244215 [Rhizopus microsporus ATCC 52813]|uniref:Uncharacterized protein n=1 Tax=Rhizopus microsporus ATCC 52813 TaxID=1340429 RepID=A0A2G4SSI6_RHIZD|nr:uncharacterized protein RHIMIDRAFT_244215 [Rhizopus microsporus ATCC 52813]PHZ11747.1 hypothetical protein RHIMIDRAFT_244215 [Rhizopus microsporus ATCC 52813]
MFQKRFDEGITLKDKLEEKISKMKEIAKEISKGRFLCLKYEAKAKSPMESDIFSMYVQYCIFDKDVDKTEKDVVVKIWSPILKRLFRRTNLRTKWGESVGDSHDAISSAGFKVDLRVAKGTMSRRRREADKANVEIARLNPSMIKITNDRTKLHIEFKTVLDKLIKEVPQKVRSYRYLWPTDHRAIPCSLKLGAAVLPNHVARTKDFREVIMLQYKFKNATTEVASCDLINDDDSSDSDNNSNNNKPALGHEERGFLPTPTR